MHAISYQLKRAHLSAVAVGRKILRGTKAPEDPDYDGVPDMTPARFDILYLVFGRKMPTMARSCSIEMTALRRALGLARATISKAVKRLVELGLVTCGLRPGGSLRNKVVTLTHEGIARIKRALHLVFTGRKLARHYRRFVGKHYDKRKPKLKNLAWIISLELDRIWQELQDVAEHLFDTSSVLYYLRGVPDECAIPKPAPLGAGAFAPASAGDAMLDVL